MEDVTRKRIMRLLEGLPEAQLYQVLDYIEFLAARYAAEASRKPDAFQRFAERVEDQMRVRALAPRALKGTMKIMSTAGKVIDGVRDLGKDLVTPGPRPPSSKGSAAGGGPASPPAPPPGRDAAASGGSGRPAFETSRAEELRKPGEATEGNGRPEEGSG